MSDVDSLVKTGALDDPPPPRNFIDVPAITA
jgi:hypothetical protein